MKKPTVFKSFPQFTISFLGTCLAILVFAGCSSTHKSAGKKLTTEGFTLAYNDKAQAGQEIGELVLNHPLPITERQLIFHMVALTYENYSLLGKAGSVFTKDDIQKAKRLLTKALNKANSQNIISFQIESDGGTTRGELFATPESLNWRFTEIQGVKYSLTRNQMARYGTAWRMVPKKGQKFHVSDKLLGAKQWTNWIEAQINLPAPANLKTSRPGNTRANPGTARSAPSPTAPQATVPGKSPQALEEKLKFLKHLYENQLIDQQEFEQKRKDLLDQYL